MIEINKSPLLIGLLSDTHIPHRTNKIPDKVIQDFKIAKEILDSQKHPTDF